MLHCRQYLLLYGALLGLLAAGYANYQMLHMSVDFFSHFAAALTAGRPVFGFIGWLLVNRVPQRLWHGVMAATHANPLPVAVRKEHAIKSLGQVRAKRKR